MFRPSTPWPRLALLCVAASACEGLVGSVEVLDRAPLQRMTAPEQAAPEPSPEPQPAARPPPDATGVEAPVGGGVGVGLEPPRLDAGNAPSADAGTADAGLAEPPPPPPELRPVLVDAPSALERIGVEGGDPRLGSCAGGFAVGVRTTANPEQGLFGERLTFVEPVCARAIASIPSPASPQQPSVELLVDPALLAWSEAEPYQGEPLASEPDERLTWVPQPPTLCSASAPLLVGLGGEYDPIAPDATNTAVIRSLVLECAPLEVAPGGALGASGGGHELITNPEAFGASGEDTFTSACPAGSVVSQLQVHAGYWLDGFVLGCSRLSAGEPLAEPE